MNDFLQSLRNGQAEKQRAPKTRKSYDNSYHYTSSPRYHSYGGGGYQPQRNPNMKRPPMPQGPPMGNQMPMEDPGMTMMADAIENLTSYVESIVKNLDYMARVQERSAEMLERQASAIERIVNHLNIAPLPEADEPEDQVFENHYVTSREPEEDIEAPIEAAQEEDNFQPPLEDAGLEPETVEPRPTRRVVRKRRKVVAQEPVKPSSASGIQVSGDTELLSRDEVMDIINTMREQGATYDQVARHLIELNQPTFSGRGEWHAQTIHRLCSRK